MRTSLPTLPLTPRMFAKGFTGALFTLNLANNPVLLVFSLIKYVFYYRLHNLNFRTNLLWFISYMEIILCLHKQLTLQKEKKTLIKDCTFTFRASVFDTTTITNKMVINLEW